MAAKQGSVLGHARAAVPAPGELELEDPAGYAAEPGLDVEEFLRALDDEASAARIRRDLVSAEASGGRGTPSFCVGDSDTSEPTTPTP